MAKYPKPPQEITERPAFFLKHYALESGKWISAHKDQMLTGVLVLAIVLLGLHVWRQYARARANEAWGEVTLAGDIPALEAAAARYARTPALPFIKMRLANAYLDSGNTLLDSGNTVQDGAAKAIKLYSEVAGDRSFSERDVARYSLAGAYELTGKFDAAEKILKELAAEDTFWGRKAKEAVEGLAARTQWYESFEAAKAAIGTAQAQEAPAEPRAAEPVTPGTQESRQASEAEGESGSAANESVSSTDSSAAAGDESIAVQATEPAAEGAQAGGAIENQSVPANTQQ